MYCQTNMCVNCTDFYHRENTDFYHRENTDFYHREKTIKTHNESENIHDSNITDKVKQIHKNK